MNKETNDFIELHCQTNDYAYGEYWECETGNFLMFFNDGDEIVNEIQVY